jgi:T-complex protein 1 subunit delta
LIVGGGAPEIEVAIQLEKHANTLSGLEPYCFRAYADALEVVPYTLSENAGLNPISIVTELRNKHENGEKTAGINVKKVRIEIQRWCCDDRIPGSKLDVLFLGYYF